MKKLIATLAALLAWTAPAMAATSFEPGVDWRTIDTRHFRITYPVELEPLGRRVAGYAEDMHGKLVPYLGAQPYEKTEIVCFDSFDDTNANASNYPHNRIMLNLRAPSPDGGMPIGRYDDWVRYVLLHEYTHILHQNLTPWALLELNTILGKVLFNYVQVEGVPRWVLDYIPTRLSDSPRFITEGIAVHMESLHTPGGREREGDQDMKLRMAVLENRAERIDQVNGSYQLDWPSGGNEYEYGSAFFQYVSATYGANKPARILQELGKLPWLGIDFAVSQVLPGKNCNTLWDETMAWLKRRYEHQAAQIKQTPLTASRRLTTSGRSHHHPHWLPDGSLTVTESYKGKSAALVRVQPDGKIERLMGKDPVTDYAFLDGGARIVFAVQGDDRFREHYDLKRYDLATKEVKQLTEGLRATDPAVSPDGKTLAVIMSGGGTNSLGLLDRDGKLLKHLTVPTPDCYYANPAWSPDGKTLVASRWQSGGIRLVQVDPATGAITELTSGSTLDFYPSFSPDGRHLIFTSDRSGVFNLYAMRLADRALFRITNVLGGAMEGAPSPDGKALAFVNYSGVGYDLHVMPLDPGAWQPVAADRILTSSFDGTWVPRQAVAATPVDMQAALAARPRPYSPVDSLTPHTYAPLIYQDDYGTGLGMSVFGQDTLRQHTYSMWGGMGLDSKRPIYGLYYQNDQLFPSLSAQYYRIPVSSLGVVGPYQVQLWNDQQALDLGVKLPGIPLPLLGPDWVSGDSWNFGFRSQYNQNASLRLFWTDQSGNPQTVQYPISDVSAADKSVLARLESAPIEGLTNSLYLRYLHADSYTRSYGIGPEGGSLSSVGYEKAHPTLGSFADYDRVWAEHRRYFSIGEGRHVLALRGLTGLSWGQKGGMYLLGGNGAQFNPQMDLTEMDTNSGLDTGGIPLRGYGTAGYGHKVGLLSAEYRVPLLTVDSGLWTLPVFMNRLFGVVGMDVGNLWDAPLFGTNPDRRFHLEDTQLGLSLELRSRITLFRFFATDLRLGVAQGLLTPAWAAGWYGMPATQLILGLGSTF